MTETVKTLKYIAECQNISQASLAKQMNVTEASVCRWFKGQREPSIRYVEKLCNVLNVKLSVAIK